MPPFLLIITALGMPGPPLFAWPMPDARVCQMNMMSINSIMNDKAVVLCFDTADQIAHMPPRPPEGERVE